MRLKDKNGSLMNWRTTPQGGILTKGKREVYLLFNKSVAKVKQSQELVASNSFNSLFKKGKKIKVLGSNVAYIKF